MQLIVISGVSGSGKSIALNVLEDIGYYCVDNLPAPMLPELVRHLRTGGYGQVAVAVDMRGGRSIDALPTQLQEIEHDGVNIRFIFLDARDDVLIQRFSETRRRHPLGNEDTSLTEAIAAERGDLAAIAEIGHHIDTSSLHPNALRGFVKELAEVQAGRNLVLMFETFGFKNGIPLDADLVFDVRCLPNPHYDAVLRPLTGRDRPVQEFLAAHPIVWRMEDDIARFVGDWLPNYIGDNRSYLTVAIGCTGGQHRSVYLAERLRERFQHSTSVLVRHRNLT
ncbi:MAG TPA: RNase adapter RapZ [Rhodocyclaceae bacterium]|nr:RNase adapter RapZ [Rhodocyclaceae bacterium]